MSSKLQVPAALSHGKEPLSTLWVDGWLDRSADLDSSEKNISPPPAEKSAAISQSSILYVSY